MTGLLAQMKKMQGSKNETRWKEEIRSYLGLDTLLKESIQSEGSANSESIVGIGAGESEVVPLFLARRGCCSRSCKKWRK